MKKILLMAAAVATTAMTMISCNGKSENYELKTSTDSLAYYYGIAQGEGLKQYMTMQLGVDTAYMDEFIKGMKEGAVNEIDPKKTAYMKGLEIGGQIQQMSKGMSQQIFEGDSTQSINAKYVLAGICATLRGKADKTGEEAYQEFQKLAEPIHQASIEKSYGNHKAANEKYLADNAKKEGVKTLPSGTQYKVLVEGDGELPTDSTKLQVNYEGKLIDGTVFDSSYERNQPFEVDLAMPRVIPGWIEVLKLMPAGSKWEVTIPQSQAYGAQNMGEIKPYSTLIFTIEVLK